jgi:hypothetical protein
MVVPGAWKGRERIINKGGNGPERKEGRDCSLAHERWFSWPRFALISFLDLGVSWCWCLASGVFVRFNIMPGFYLLSICCNSVVFELLTTDELKLALPGGTSRLQSPRAPYRLTLHRPPRLPACLPARTSRLKSEHLVGGRLDGTGWELDGRKVKR